MRVSIGAGLALAVLLALPASGADKATRTAGGKAPETKAAVPAAKAPVASGMKVHVDPVTGELLPEPATAARGAGAPAPDLPPLATQDSPVPGGGQMVVLDDRFMLEMTATVAPGGEVRHVCRTEESKQAGPAKKAVAPKAAQPSKEARRER